jgi:glycosyltransferase involved in cell wall biosynthesis
LVREHIAADDSIINTGFLSSPEVQELLMHAGIFALPSSHEGLPISLLEAMKLGTPVVASDIAANREMRLDENSYFRVGDTDTLCLRLRELAALDEEERRLLAERLTGLCARYDWDLIAESTMKVVERLAGLPPETAPSYRTSSLRTAPVRPTQVSPAPAPPARR